MDKENQNEEINIVDNSAFLEMPTLEKEVSLPKVNLFRNKIFKLVKLFIFILVTVGSVFIYFNFIMPPFEFPDGEIITIEAGNNTKQVANILKEKKVISSADFLVLALVLNEADSNIVAGDYLFESPLSVFEVARRISLGIYGDTRIRLVIAEGMANHEIAEYLDSKIPNFDAEQFKSLASGLEGYLFPDTYLVFPGVTEEELVKMMRDNFEVKTAELQNLAIENNKDWADVVTMASIIEKEAFAGDQEEHYIISGILWKRIEIDMPLQVDAPFRYLLGKSSEELTLADLRMDSPYNTYVNKGLPIGPINNPGLLSLKAAIQPKPSPYLFYLHDKTGQVHYGVNHNEHVINKRLYLN